MYIYTYPVKEVATDLILRKKPTNLDGGGVCLIFMLPVAPLQTNRSMMIQNRHIFTFYTC